MQFKSFLTTALIAGAVFLTGCSDRAPTPPIAGAPPAAATAAQAKAPATPKELEGLVQGFSLGSPMRELAVYVFFDAQCKYCTKLWFEAEPLQAQARFVWVPVALLNKASLAQGATILGAANPLIAMQEHEMSFQDGKGGITASSNSSEQEEVVKRNTEVFKSFAAQGVPFTFAVNAKTGGIVKFSGAASTADLAKQLGLEPPQAPEVPASATEAAAK